MQLAIANESALPLHVEFFVPGNPAPGGSKKGFYNKKLNRVLMVPDSEKTKPWMAVISACAMEAVRNPQTGKGTVLCDPVLLWIEFRLARPKSHYRSGKHASELKPDAPRFSTSKPDTTKLVRALEDACTGIVWHDDSQVAMQNIVKRYADPNEIPGAHVKVYLMCRPQ
jgi:Holliday junction resolvase RusA-like endonuclease